jgi:hypothetical protein
VIAPAYGSAEGSSLWLQFEHMSSDGVVHNCRCVEESCRTWTEDRAGTLLSGNTWSYMGSNWVCSWLWINMNLGMRYTSQKDILFGWYSVVIGFCSKVSGWLGIIMCRTSLSAVRVCWSHNVYAVSVREDGECGVTKERFNIEKERWRYDADSRAI